MPNIDLQAEPALGHWGMLLVYLVTIVFSKMQNWKRGKAQIHLLVPYNIPCLSQYEICPIL